MRTLLNLFVTIFYLSIANAQLPVITSFSPELGAVGTVIEISGENLSNPTSFSISGVTAIVVANTDTLLVGMVMPGTTTGNVSITTGNGTATSASVFTVTPTSFPSVQQGEKLVGTGAIGAAFQGVVSLSADGNTAIVGGLADDSHMGAAWIWVRSGDVWTQQGNKLVGTGVTGLLGASQGQSVDISANGNTVIVGGDRDNNNTGAAWVFTRSGEVWSQQGNKLVGSGIVGIAEQGYSVSISADGNTAIIGGCSDSNGKGAAWIFTRTGNVWSQQGDKLVGTGAIGSSSQGISVSLSLDGNTAMVGGPYDNNGIGAAWIYTRTGNTWSQQGEKLVGRGYVGVSKQGTSVELSADGNTAIVGGWYDNNDIGAAWVFTRTGNVWSQQGEKIVGTGYIGAAFQGTSVSLTADGNTAIVGGQRDNGNVGATWVYTRSGGVWTQQGEKFVGTGAIGGSGQGQSISISADGNTAIEAGGNDNNQIGASWVFVSESSNVVQSYFEDNDIVIYPNPAKNNITFKSNLFLRNAILSAYNIQGQLILQQQLQNTEAIIDISNFAKGCYLIRVSNSEGSKVKRLLKE